MIDEGRFTSPVAWANPKLGQICFFELDKTLAFFSPCWRRKPPIGAQAIGGSAAILAMRFGISLAGTGIE